MTWWGHATATIVDSGVRVLTDPVLTPSLAHLRRRRGAVPGPDARLADVVVISHLHADHLHRPSLDLLPSGTLTLVPRGAAPLLSRTQLDIREVTPGDSVDVGPLRLRVLPAEHPGKRHPVSRFEGPALGFVIDGAAHTYFPGDTELGGRLLPALDDIGPLDALLVPIGGWGPSLGDGHMDPTQAVELAAMLRPTVVVPVHWGTFWPRGMAPVRPELFDRPGERFAELMAALPDIRFAVPEPDGATPVTVPVSPGGADRPRG